MAFNWSNPLDYLAVAAGGVIGFVVGGPLGAIAGAGAGYQLASGVEGAIQDQKDAAKAQQDAITQQGFAEAAAAQAQAQADLEKQQQAMAWEQSRRALAAEATQRDIQVSQANASSRKAAIDTYQADSSGQAAAAGSGTAPGSTPYAALEASSNENQRTLRDWWKNTSQNIQLSEQRGVSIDQTAQINWQSEDLRQTSLLTQKSQYDWQASKYADAATKYGEQASNLNLAGNIFGAVIDSASTAYSLYSNLGALDIMAKKGGLDGIDLGTVIKDAPQLKYAQMTGDYSYFQTEAKVATPALQIGPAGGSVGITGQTSFAIPSVQLPQSPQFDLSFAGWNTGRVSPLLMAPKGSSASPDSTKINPLFALMGGL